MKIQIAEECASDDPVYFVLICLCDNKNVVIFGFLNLVEKKSRSYF